eukprot:3727015-Prymnesium_polylepis.1
MLKALLWMMKHATSVVYPGVIDSPAQGGHKGAFWSMKVGVQARRHVLTAKNMHPRRTRKHSV